MNIQHCLQELRTRSTIPQPLIKIHSCHWHRPCRMGKLFNLLYTQWICSVGSSVTSPTYPGIVVEHIMAPKRPGLRGNPGDLYVVFNRETAADAWARLAPGWEPPAKGKHPSGVRSTGWMPQQRGKARYL